MTGKKELNPLELSDNFVKKLKFKNKLSSFAKTMGLVTFIVGIVQGLTAYSIFIDKYYVLSIGFTIFSILSVAIKLKSKINLFPILKSIAYISILVVLIISSQSIKVVEKYPLEDKNTLYYKEFDSNILRFEKIDSALGQNQIVIVQRSTNNGKDFKDVTNEGITVSNKALFTFINEKQGFAIDKSNNMKANDKYYGLYVTNDGGKTFEISEINYHNPNIEVLTIESTPYIENNHLILKCSIYQINQDNTGYEDVELYFISEDNGLTWNLKE